MEFNETTTTRVPDVQSPATFEQQVGMTVAIAILGVWCAAGNLLTIFAITTKRYMRNKTNAFILSLAISDFLSGVIASPLWLYRRTWGFNPWELGQIACKMYWFMDETTSYSTAMHIASFAVWRFILVRWPHRMGSTKMRSIIIWISTIWVVSVVFGGFVYSTFYESIEKPQDGGVYSAWPMCSIKFRDDGVRKFQIYYTISSSVFLLFPMFVLIVMSLLITKELYFSTTFKSEMRKIKERRAVAQLAMIATLFMIGYLPMTTYMMWTVRATGKDKIVDYWVGVFAYFSLRFSECMNPVAYNVSSNKMRHASREVIGVICPCLRKDRKFAGRSTKKFSQSNDTGTNGVNVASTNGNKFSADDNV